MSTPSGVTRVAGIIGSPIAHTRSPAIYNAAFAAASLDWVFVAFAVPDGEGAEAVRAVRSLALGGLSVTMPHKEAAADACDELSDDAARLRSVNCVVPLPGGSLRGESTDGAGILAALADEGVDLSDARVVVLGAGGAARAISLALGNAGARVTVAARRLDAARVCAELAGGEGIELDGLSVREADVVVNATPVGMQGESPIIEVATLPSHAVVYDTIYHPAVTPLLAAASARGLRVANGLGMLVHQAAHCFEHWTGVDAPLDAMRDAVLDG